MTTELIDRIYEAAFIPDEWPGALAGITALSGSSNTAFFLFRMGEPVRGCCEDIIRPMFDEFVAGDAWESSDSVQRIYTAQPAGFVVVDDLLSAEQIERDPVRQKLRAFGIGAHACSAVPMPTGELITFVSQRWLSDGTYDQASIDLLDGLRPHLARAGLIASRLGLQRAQIAVSTLDALGLPAAVISASGQLRATNDLFDQLPRIFSTRARDMLVIEDAAANELFKRAVHNWESPVLVRSIPIVATEHRPATVIHLLPLRRSAQDIFSGGDMIVVATHVTASTLVPSPSLLSGLFDLAPAEAKLAAALATGTSLKQVAVDQNIRTTTARHYLEQIFRKTGTHRQSELVALIKSTLPINRSD